MKEEKLNSQYYEEQKEQKIVKMFVWTSFDWR